MRIAKRDGISLEEINNMFKYGQEVKTIRADVTYKGIKRYYKGDLSACACM